MYIETEWFESWWYGNYIKLNYKFNKKKIGWNKNTLNWGKFTHQIENWKQT